jgi:hypothetical protein
MSGCTWAAKVTTAQKHKTTAKKIKIPADELLL